MGISRKLRAAYVAFIYADHNRSKSVRTQISSLLSEHGERGEMLNVGSGPTKLHARIKNLDIEPGPNVDYVGSAENMPFEDNKFDLIITQEAFEHIQSPAKALSECYRVLKPGGVIYFQVPFIIGYHPGPTDFIRFTKEGVIQYLKDAGFEPESLQISVGSATGFYRISVEFFAILFSGPVRFLYIPLKAFFALVLYPLKLLDPWLNTSPERDRIPGGYLAVGKKR